MNELIEQPQIMDDINIRFVFVNGDIFEQSLPYSHLNGVEDLIAWFRDPKGSPTWTWLVPSVQKIHMLHRIHIMCIDIDGYIEPDEGNSRWYHRMVDRVRIWLMSRKVYANGRKGGGNIGKGESIREEGQSSRQEAGSQGEQQEGR